MKSRILHQRSQHMTTITTARRSLKKMAHLLLKTLALLCVGHTVSQQVAQVMAKPYGSIQSNPAGSSGSSGIPKLPNINIYIKKQEVKKLLGIEARIDYVTHGNINLYPFRFTIPLGYNQSDLIFTWQNLGQTNVNYSISLAFGNLKAVETPLINITRTGLIPKHEQVFKITLPCSGRITDEVDVQVLILISGYVPVGELLDSEPGAPSNQQPLNASEQLMQSDQAAPRMQFVEHKLAIRRKKICTAEPTLVSAQRPPLSVNDAVMQRPAPLPDLPEEPELPPVVGTTSNSAPPASPSTPMDNEQTQPASGAAKTVADLWRGALPYGLSGAGGSYLDAAGAHPSVINPGLFGGTGWPPMQQAYQPQPPLPSSRLQTPSFSDLPPPPYRTSPALRAPPQTPASNHQQQVNHPQQQQVSNSALMLTLVALSLLASLALAVVALLGSSSWRTTRTPLDKLSALTGSILRRAAPAPQVNKYKSASVIGSLPAGGPKSGIGSSVTGLSVGLAGKQQGGTQSGALPGYCFKSTCGPTSGYYTTGRQAASQQHHYHYQPTPTGDLLGSEYQCHQQHQQGPASAPPPPPPQYPIYHIPTGINPSQTTRLIWNTGNGSSPDGFLIEGGAYMPLSNAARSDNGSVYQTIY